MWQADLFDSCDGLRSEELQGLVDEVLVELEHAAVPGVRVDHELGIARQGLWM